jgi:hypothetical protein
MNTDFFTQRHKGAIFRRDLHELTRIENALKALRSTAQGWQNPLDGCERLPQARERRRQETRISRIGTNGVGPERGKQIVFVGEQFDAVSVQNWRKKMLVAK